MTVPSAVVTDLESGWAFPSGHSARVFCLISAASITNRKIQTLGYCIATLVGFSRIYLGVHYPLDVFSGAVLGFVLGKIVHHYDKWLIIKVEHSIEHLERPSSTNP